MMHFAGRPESTTSCRQHEKPRIDVGCKRSHLPGQLVLFNVYTNFTSATAKTKISSTSSVSARLGIALRYCVSPVALFPRD
jgi:hypothetical protein